MVKTEFQFTSLKKLHIETTNVYYEQHGIFLERLKISVIKPISKKNDPTDPINYRPVNLLNYFSKIFEKVLYNRQYSFFKKFGVFNSQQNGFTPGKSTEIAIFKLIETLIVDLEKCDLLLLYFIDFSKAFDSFIHNIL